MPPKSTRLDLTPSEICSGDANNRREKKVSDRQVIELVTQILSEASYRPALPGFSVTNGGFAFYSKEKLVVSLSIEPGRILRLSNAHAEENLVVERSTIDALNKVYESTR